MRQSTWVVSPRQARHGFCISTRFARTRLARQPAQNGEASIRTLSVSLLAVAAIAASVFLTRNRQEKLAGASAGEQLSAEQSLDAIRAAGL